MPGEPAADVGERVVIGLRGGLQRRVELVRALVERGTVAGAQPDAGAGLGQVVQVRVAEDDDLRVRRVGRDRVQGRVEPGRQLAGDEGLGSIQE
jgi:hypothetical protein